ncbi:MAG: helix-turn-helix transcriptional regulator [Eubacteriales bacterium]|nr:helix-turn-helix transcriptional regulator [Eubacteriales bacterium]
MNIEFEKQIGDNIRRLRIYRELTQEQLSAKLQTIGIDVTRSALAKIEVGQRHIYPDEIKGIRDVLDVQYENIFPEKLPNDL